MKKTTQQTALLKDLIAALRRARSPQRMEASSRAMNALGQLLRKAHRVHRERPGSSGRAASRASLAR